MLEEQILARGFWNPKHIAGNHILRENLKASILGEMLYTFIYLKAF